MQESKFGVEVSAGKEKVPKWNRDNYDDKVICSLPVVSVVRKSWERESG